MRQTLFVVLLAIVLSATPVRAAMLQFTFNGVADVFGYFNENGQFDEDGQLGGVQTTFTSTFVFDTSVGTPYLFDGYYRLDDWAGSGWIAFPQFGTWNAFGISLLWKDGGLTGTGPVIAGVGSGHQHINLSYGAENNHASFQFGVCPSHFFPCGPGSVTSLTIIDLAAPVPGPAVGGGLAGLAFGFAGAFAMWHSRRKHG